MGTTEQIAGFIVGTDYESIPGEAVCAAKNGFLDGLGVTLAGSIEPSSEIMASYVKDVGGHPEAGIIGYGFKSSAPQAALANGTMAHALDYDDFIPPMYGHPTVPVLPAVLALGQLKHRSGRDVLAAYIIGLEVETRIGSGIGDHHYNVGWHPTATLGTLGAAAAAAKLLDLDVSQTRMALGIAASQASGLRQNFGTMSKPFHAGMAARNGIVAATLAGKGFTADENILESRFGFLPVLGGEGEYNLAAVTENLGSPFVVVSPGLDIKPYPCCRFTHRCIDAMLHIVAEYHPAPDDITGIECHTSTFVPRIVTHHQPATALEGKFSMEYCMARAIIDGDMRIAQFTEEKVLDPTAQELLKKVRYVHPPGAEGRSLAEQVMVTLRDGRQYSYEVLYAKGSPENPLTHEELTTKYRDCAGTVLPPEAKERSLEMVHNIEKLGDITELCELITNGSD